MKRIHKIIAIATGIAVVAAVLAIIIVINVRRRYLGDVIIPPYAK